jgi:hypothetical protein
MIWLYERGDRATRIETRFEAESGEYLLEVHWSDGAATFERFQDSLAFKTRVLALEQQLVEERWTQRGDSPQLIQADWWKP